MDAGANGEGIVSRSFATIVTSSHLPYAQVLAASLQAAGNAETLHVLVIDGKENGLPMPTDQAVRYLLPDDIRIPGYRDMCVYFNAFELCNALKPFLVGHLMETGNEEEVIYLDSDIYVVGSFDRLETGGCALALTPHHLVPPPLDLPYLSEAEIADLGFLNGGFACWRRSGSCLEILKWMQTRFPRYAFADRRRGLFVDQKLLPLLQAYFPEKVSVLRDTGLNIAFWNAHERPVSRAGGRYVVGDRPVTFFHMSGYKLDRPLAPCAYLPETSNRHILRKSPWLADVIEEYGRQLGRSAAPERTPVYPHDRYQGMKLTADLRRHYYEHRKLDPWDVNVLRLRLIEVLKQVKRLLFPFRPKP